MPHQRSLRRRTLLATFLLIVACTEPTAPVSVAGAWSSLPGDGVAPEFLQFELTESGDSVSGTGSWGPVTYQVSGRYTKPGISLIFVNLQLSAPDDTTLRFKGRVQGGKMIGAPVTAQGVPDGSLTFYKQ
jgi:hypothetical protein